jgi:uncharacterized protein (TIGR00255 family)
MALSGMTGFGRADGALGAWSWTVEARSVNGRSLETRFRGPAGFDSLERVAREAAQARFQRGQININVAARRAESAMSVRVNLQQLERYLDIAEPYVRSGRLAAPSVDGLFALRGVIEAADEDDDADSKAVTEAAMIASIGAALDALKAARLGEGASLTPVLTGQVDRIEALVREADQEAGAQPAVLKERFERRIAELLADRGGVEDRIVQEAAMLATRADVREELDRLASHIAAARTLVGGDGAAGRRLDFLTQEFMREANTLCSKAATSALTAAGLELKATIDQLREQVQNVE